MGKEDGSLTLLIALIIWLIVFVPSFTVVWARKSTHDRRGELLFFNILKAGGQPKRGTEMESLLLSVILPYYLGQLLKVKSTLIFHLAPTVFHAMIPAFAFLLAQEFLSVEKSLIAAAFTVTNYFFLRDPNWGRVSIGVGLLAALTWAIFSGNLFAALPLAVVLALSYYATTHYAIALFGTLLVWLLATHGVDNLSFTLLLVTLALLLASGVWHYKISAKVGWKCAAIAQAVLLNSAKGIEQGTTNTYAVSWEPVISLAFGKGVLALPFSQKIEWLTSWVVVLAVGVGILYSLVNLPSSYGILAGLSYGVVALAIVNKPLARYYGAPRLWFTALPLLAPTFALLWGTKEGVALLVLHGVVLLFNTMRYPPTKVVEDNWSRQTAIHWKEMLKE